MRTITLLEAGRAPAELAARLEEQESPYLRLVIELESQSGRELFVVEFPPGVEQAKALAHVIGLLRGFLPCADGTQDRRVRRLPEVEAWQPVGAEREKLAGLGGTVPTALRERMAQRLSALLAASGEEALVSVAVPALEEYHSPVRLIALTRRAVLVLPTREGRGRAEDTVQVQRYDLSALTSVQLRSSLVGSGLSLFVPQASGPVQRIVVPFHSPALAWFVPVFTRLRVALSGPYHMQEARHRREERKRLWTRQDSSTRAEESRGSAARSAICSMPTISAYWPSRCGAWNWQPGAWRSRSGGEHRRPCGSRALRGRRLRSSRPPC